MSYTAEISRTNPSCILFVVDLSGSMADNFGNQQLPKPKAEGVSDAINRLLQNLVIKCSKSESVRDYYYVGAIGYNGNGVKPALGGKLANSELVAISEIADYPVRIEERTKKVDDGAGGLIDQVVKFPIWFDPTAIGGTPMTQAFQTVNSIIENWLLAHPDCFPPIVIHITDGASTDGDPTNNMLQLTGKSSTDGNVLLFNLHLSSNNVQPLTFPDNVDNVNDPFAKLLFNTASPLTPFMFQVATNEYGLNLADGAKGFVLNGDLTLIITALEIGTRPSNLR